MLFEDVMLPSTVKEPVISNCEPEANTRFDLFTPVPVPFPIIKALCAEDDRLYWP
jgi:hypothetical protein